MKKNKILLIIIIICLGITIIYFLTKNSNNKRYNDLIPIKISATKECVDLLNKIEGLWINEKYIIALKKKKSPIKATKEIECCPEIQIIKIKDDKFQWGSSTWNFHEGWIYNILKFENVHKNNKYIIFIDNIGNDSFALQVNNNNEKIESIQFFDKVNYKDKQVVKKDNYIRVNEQDVSEYVNNELFVGTYQDNQGNKYVFTNEGKAIWPNKTFFYYVKLDSFMAENDSIIVFRKDKDHNRVVLSYSFEFQNDNLLFYEEDDTDDGVIPEKAKKPFLILKKLEKIRRLS